MKPEKSPAEREFAIARVLRPLGDKPLSMVQAKVAVQLLGVHWSALRDRIPVDSRLSRRHRLGGATRIWAYYCATCVFLNPADVTAPRWKRAWLDPCAAKCDVHDMQLETIPARSVRSARNFEHLLRMVSKLEEKRRQKRWMYLH